MYVYAANVAPGMGGSSERSRSNTYRHCRSIHRLQSMDLSARQTESGLARSPIFLPQRTCFTVVQDLDSRRGL